MADLSEVQIEPLVPRHAVAVQRLVCHPDLAATTRLPVPYPRDGASQYIEQCLAEQALGKTMAFAILNSTSLVGLCGLHGMREREKGELGYWIGRPFWGQGYASQAVGKLLEFAFRKRGLGSVQAEVLELNHRSRRVLEKNGFKLISHRVHDSHRWSPDERLAQYAVDPIQWVEHQNSRVVSMLHPLLRAILEVELAVGNVILETRKDWPEPGNLFVRMKDSFRHRRVQLPPGVHYSMVKAPHWWEEEFTSERPRHILAR